MNEEALGTYLNDHLAGSTFGLDHARQLQSRYTGTPFGERMAEIADQIEQERDQLVALMERLDLTRNPVKAATAWVAEKAGRVKFSGASSGDPELGNFLALEAMSLGIEGKRSLWRALREISAEHAELDEANLDQLIQQSADQRQQIEHERLTAAHRAFGA